MRVFAKGCHKGHEAKHVKPGLKTDNVLNAPENDDGRYPKSRKAFQRIDKQPNKKKAAYNVDCRVDRCRQSRKGLVKRNESQERMAKPR